MFDTARHLGLGGLAELELVEDIARDLGVVVGIPQAVELRAWIVGAWCGQFLMRCLHADSRREDSKRQVVWCKLHLDAAFLLLVGENLPHAISREIRRIGETDL